MPAHDNNDCEMARPRVAGTSNGAQPQDNTDSCPVPKEHPFCLAAENARDIVYRLRLQPAPHIEYVSPSVEEITGFTPGDLYNNADLIVEQTFPEDREAVSRVLAGNLGQQDMWRWRKVDGEVIWLEHRYTPLYENGILVAIEGIARDVTRQKIELQALHHTSELLESRVRQRTAELLKANLELRAEIEERIQIENALIASEQRLRRITDNMLDMVSQLDERGVYEYASPSHRSVLGYSPEALIGRTLFDFVHPDDLPAVKTAIEDAIRTMKPSSVEFRYLNTSGLYVWIESVINPVQVHGDSCSGVIMGSRDITDRKKAITALRDSENILRKQVAYLNTLIDNLNELFYTYDRQGRLTFVNKKCEDLGYSFEEMIGMHLTDLVLPEDRPLVLRQMHRRLIDNTPGSYEIPVLKKDGTTRLIRVNSSPIEAEGEVVGGMILAEDITERRNMEKEIARLDKLNLIGEMAAGIGHEIRNPMTTVRGFLQVLACEEDLAAYVDYFRIMIDELDRANDIISEFLSLAKNKAVNLKLQDVNSIVRALYPLTVAEATKEDKAITLDIRDIPPLAVDQQQIRQLILNLVRNGLEASAPGSRIWIRTYVSERGATLEVEDQGTGIPPEIMDKLGTPFFTTKEDGTGLGLAVCYSIAARHQATITVDTSETGTVFAVHFPIPRSYSDSSSGQQNQWQLSPASMA